MKTIEIQYYKSPVGDLIVGSFEGKLCLLDWQYRRMRSQIDTRVTKGLNATFVEKNSPIIETCIHQFEAYCRGDIREFDIPILLVGTTFQKKVWEELRKVTYGTTCTYLELSERIGNPKAIRAVAGANGANAISVIVPCHRIIGSSGDLVGYAGGLSVKKKLLHLEHTIEFQLDLFS